MTSVRINRDVNNPGWIHLPGNLGRMVAHFEDGHTEELENLVALVRLPVRKKRKIVQLDCYEKA